MTIKRGIKNQMKKNITKQLSLGLLALMASVAISKASVTINYELAEITAGGALVGSGTVLFISHGSNNTLNSTAWSTGSSFILGDDLFFAAVPIVDGIAAGALSEYTVPVGTVANTTQFSAIFIKGLTSSDINYNSGSLLNGKTFSDSGTSYDFGIYRTSNIEAFGGSTAGNIGYIFPSEGSANNLFSYSNTGEYSSATYTASLATSSSFSLVPEPSTGALLMIGSVGLVAMRRMSKV